MTSIVEDRDGERYRSKDEQCGEASTRGRGHSSIRESQSKTHVDVQN